MKLSLLNELNWAGGPLQSKTQPSTRGTSTAQAPDEYDWDLNQAMVDAILADEMIDVSGWDTDHIVDQLADKKVRTPEDAIRLFRQVAPYSEPPRAADRFF